MDPRLLEYLRQIGNAAQQSIQFVDGMSYAEFEKRHQDATRRDDEPRDSWGICREA